MATFLGCAPGASKEGASLVAGCGKDTECPQTFFCVNHACRKDPAPCDSDLDCLQDDVCSADGCRTSCLVRPCESGFACDTGLQQCVAEPTDGGTTGNGEGSAPPPECKADADCHAGYLCQEGSCVCTKDGWESYAAPTLTKSCTECHAYLASYQQVFTQQRLIATRVGDGTMPPSKSAFVEKDRLLRWLVCGAPK